ncbi:MAG: hypothetical protein UX36_C0008G0003 [Microgenomates group bacterium GW2011_GWC1_46_15]|nr:MAG: hypothetical protein UX36_C0008G0003 [Microgenomates group bacterium GW2011_GWC1_46_15]
MKKLYLILKILLVLAALIALGYLVTPPDSEVILTRPWLKRADNLKMTGTPLIISDGTQGQYGDDLRIGVGNIRIGDYEIDGVKETGVTATLWVFIRDKSEENKIITLYIGQSFEIDKYVITLEDISGSLVSLFIRDVSQ